MENQNPVVMEKITSLSDRIKSALSTGRVCVIEADKDEYRLYTSIQEKKDTIKLVLLNLDLEQDYAIELLKETRQRFVSTPIIIITTACSRGFFVEAMLQGATECIIKPYHDETLIQMLTKYLLPDTLQKETVTFDLSRYLKGELRKAEKGNFAISAMVLALGLKPGAEIYEIKSTTAGNIVYENIKELFWETDAFIRFASKYYLGIFPFCDEKNTQIINRKIQNSLEEIKQEYKLLEFFELVTVYVSYPYDTNDSTRVFELLISRVREQMKEEITANL